MADDWVPWVLGGVAVLITALLVGFYAFQEGLGLGATSDQNFRAIQQVPEPVLTNHETISFTNPANGKEYVIRIDREVK